MEFWQWIGLMCFVAAGTIFAMLCVSFKSVWINPRKEYKAKLEKKFDVPKMPAEDCDTQPDNPRKETNYNKTWKRVWDI